MAFTLRDNEGEEMKRTLFICIFFFFSLLIHFCVIGKNTVTLNISCRVPQIVKVNVEKEPLEKEKEDMEESTDVTVEETIRDGQPILLKTTVTK